MKNYGVKSDLIRSIMKNLEGYDKKYMHINFNLDDELPPNAIENHNLIIVVRGVFYESNKYYPQVFLDECLYKL